MLRILLAVACLFLAVQIVSADDTTVSVGGTSITLPAPEGFFRYDGKSAKIDTFVQKPLAASGIRLLAIFGSEETLADVLLDQFPKIARNFSAQTPVSLESSQFTSTSFSEMKPELRNTLSSMKYRDLANEVETSIHATLGTSLTVGEMIPLGIFGDTGDSVCFSMLTKMQLASVSYISVVACSIVRVNNRLVYLYASSLYRQKSDIDWARQSVQQWRDAVLKANAR
jgi:hypothetical protein